MPQLLLLVVEAVLAAIFVAGRFMTGEKIVVHSKPFWAGLFALGMFGFFQILLDPASGYLPVAHNTPIKTVFELFVGFGLFSVAFWRYFRYRKHRYGTHPAPLSQAQSFGSS
ncbi:MAG: hypothetical protein ABR507_10885 [Actinomycetota bacterium]